MRIAYLLTQDLESPSGLGRYLPLASQLVQRGHQVHISAIHPDYQNLQSRQFSINGIDVKYVAPMHVKKHGNLKHYYGTLDLLGVTMRATWNLSVDIIRSKVDIIHVGKPHPMNSIAGMIGNIKALTSLCVDCDDFETGSMQFSAAWQKILISQFERKFPRFCNMVTVNTHFLNEKLLSWGVKENKIIYIPNGVDYDRFSQTESGKVEELRRALKLEGTRVIAYIGSMSLPSHPVDLLIKAFALILQKMPQARLLIVGGGGDYPAIVEMVKQNGLSNSVIFVGRVLPKDVPLYYQLADVTVDPVYDNEAARGRSPLKLFESWASGVPFVTSRVGDRINLIGPSKSGLLTDDDTEDSYARAIIEVISSAELAETLRKNGMIEVQSYTWEKLSLRLEQAYQRLLLKHGYSGTSLD